MIPTIDGEKQKSFMVWIPPALHKEVREKLYQDRLTARALVVWFLKKYVGGKLGEHKTGIDGNSPGA